jgi:hypothetical protein
MSTSYSPRTPGGGRQAPRPEFPREHLDRLHVIYGLLLYKRPINDDKNVVMKQPVSDSLDIMAIDINAWSIISINQYTAAVDTIESQLHNAIRSGQTYTGVDGISATLVFDIYFRQWRSGDRISGEPGCVPGGSIVLSQTLLSNGQSKTEQQERRES